MRTIFLPGLVLLAALAGCHHESEDEATIRRLEKDVAPEHSVDPALRRKIAEGMAQDIKSMSADIAAVKGAAGEAEAQARQQAYQQEQASDEEQQCASLQQEIDALERRASAGGGEVITAEEMAAVPAQRERLLARQRELCAPADAPPETPPSP